MMDNNMLINWLVSEKGFTTRSAKDVVFRINRVKKLLNCEEISGQSVDELECVKEFANCTVSIKSQMRRAIKLLCEYQKSICED